MRCLTYLRFFLRHILGCLRFFVRYDLFLCEPAPPVYLRYDFLAHGDDFLRHLDAADDSDAESSETPDASVQPAAPAVEPAGDSDSESIETLDDLPPLVSDDEPPPLVDPVVWACCGEVHPVVMRLGQRLLPPPLIIRNDEAWAWLID